MQISLVMLPGDQPQTAEKKFTTPEIWYDYLPAYDPKRPIMLTVSRFAQEQTTRISQFIYDITRARTPLKPGEALVRGLKPSNDN